MFISCIGDATSDGQQFYDLLSFKVLSSIRLPWNVNVSDIIMEGTWAFSPSNQELQPIWNSVHSHPRIVLQDHRV